MTDQTAHNQELIAANMERLRILEVQAAKFGADTQPHILTEIASIRAVIQSLTTVEDLTPAPKPYDKRQYERRQHANTNEQATLRMIATVQATVSEVGNVKADLRMQIADVRSDVGKQLDSTRADVRNQIADVKSLVDDQIGNIQDDLSAFRKEWRIDAQATQAKIDNFVRNLFIGLGVAVLFVGVVVIIVYIWIN